jgi:PAS domain S-box-containing protein/putative nucleotidyltransferase with HDIG domain
MAILPGTSTLSDLRLRALRTSLLYIVVGALWIVFSDYLLYALIGPAARLPVYQTLKGWLFMVVTGAALYGLVYYDLLQMYRYEHSLRESENNYRALTDSITDLFFALDERLRYTYWNKAMEKLTRKKAGDVLGRSMAELFPDTAGSIFEKNYRLTLEKKTPHSFIGEFTIEGNKRFYDVSVYPSLNGGLSVIGKDITERMESRRKLEDTLATVRSMLDDTVTVLSQTAEKRDPSMAGHQVQVATLATAIARGMGLSTDRVETVRIAGILHDIGKIAVPAELLSRPGPLRESEYRIVQLYPEVSYDILKNIRFPWPVAEVVREHQEKWDGSGYPRGLRNGQILREAMILRVADFVVSRSTHRAYRAAPGVTDTLKDLEKDSGRLYDPEVVAACLRLFRESRFVLQGPLITA